MAEWRIGYGNMNMVNVPLELFQVGHRLLQIRQAKSQFTHVIHTYRFVRTWLPY